MEALASIGTVASAIIGAAGLIAVWRTLSEMQTQRMEAAKPVLMVEPHLNMISYEIGSGEEMKSRTGQELVFSLENIGSGPAFEAVVFVTNPWLMSHANDFFRVNAGQVLDIGMRADVSRGLDDMVPVRPVPVALVEGHTVIFYSDMFNRRWRTDADFKLMYVHTDADAIAWIDDRVSVVMGRPVVMRIRDSWQLLTLLRRDRLSGYVRRRRRDRSHEENQNDVTNS